MNNEMLNGAVVPSRPPRFLLTVLMTCAVLPLLQRGLVMALPAEKLGHEVWIGLQAIESLLALTAAVAFLVFMYRVFRAMRLAGRSTRYSPGLAVGSWFIPLANLVMPALAVAEAYRLRTGRGAGIVAGWWLSYLLLIAFRGFDGLLSGGLLSPTDTLFAALPYIGWSHTLVTTVTFGLWAAIVSAIAAPNAR